MCLVSRALYRTSAWLILEGDCSLPICALIRNNDRGLMRGSAFDRSHSARRAPARFTRAPDWISWVSPGPCKKVNPWAIPPSLGSPPAESCAARSRPWILCDQGASYSLSALSVVRKKLARSVLGGEDDIDPGERTQSSRRSRRPIGVSIMITTTMFSLAGLTVVVSPQSPVLAVALAAFAPQADTWTTFTAA